MLQILVKAKSRFVHGQYKFDRAGEEGVLPEHLAKELAAAGLVEIAAKPRSAKVMPDPNVGGSDAALSASPAGQASPAKTLSLSGSGKNLPPRSTK